MALHIGLAGLTYGPCGPFVIELKILARNLKLLAIGPAGPIAWILNSSVKAHGAF